jgi:hypothetical protein
MSAQHLAMTIWHSTVLPRRSGIPFALGMALFIPQFYAPAAVRIAHGVLVAAGLVWIVAGLWKSGSSEVAGSPAYGRAAG